jgi:hypothetical protein
VAHPDFLDGGAPAHDIGICRLAEPVQDVPRLPLLVGCEAEVLRPGAEAVIAGFGQADTDAAFGTKRYAFTVVGSELRSDGTVFVGDAVVNGCLGDSGGPAFIRMTDDTWRVAGVLTYGPECGEGVSLYASVPGRIAWLEEASGVDLTPCHDDDGQWAPTALCDTIPADPLAIGTWTNACAGPVVATAATCEPTDGTGGATSGDSATSGDTDFGPPLASTVEGCGCAAANPRTRALWLLVLAVGQPRRRGRSRSSSRPRDALNESVLRV